MAGKKRGRIVISWDWRLDRGLLRRKGWLVNENLERRTEDKTELKNECNETHEGVHELPYNLKVGSIKVVPK